VSDNNTKQQVIELNIDPSLRTIWVDNIHVAKRLDGISCVRLSTHLPEGIFEQMRFMTSEDHLKNFVNAICHNLNYFPDKDSVKNDLNKHEKA
jgi:hypothetical protein